MSAFDHRQRLFVTGAAGFLGRSFVAAAKRAGHSVVALTRRPSPLLADLADAVIVADMLDLKATALSAGIDAIVHFATGTDGDDAHLIDVAANGTAGLFAIARERGIARFIHISSMSVYAGTGARTAGWLEGSMLDPQPERRGLYARSKTLADRALQNLASTDGLGSMELTILRPGLVFGGEMQSPLAGVAIELPFGLAFGLGRPDQGVPYLDIDDFNNGLLALVDAPPRPGTVTTFDVLSGPPPRKDDFLRLYSELSGQARHQVWAPSTAALMAARGMERLLAVRGTPRSITYNVRRMYRFDPAALPQHRFWQRTRLSPKGDIGSSIRVALSPEREPVAADRTVMDQLRTTAAAMLSAAYFDQTSRFAQQQRLVLVGAGRIASEMHVPALRSLPGYAVTAVVDRDLALARTLAAEFPDARARRRLDEVEDELWANSSAVVATPGATHYEIAIELLQRGASLLIEKPVVLLPEHFRSLCEMAAATERAVTVFQNYRLRPNVLRLWRFLLDHDVGSLVKAMVVFHSGRVLQERARWLHEEKQHRVLPMELAIHMLDLACLAGGGIDQISSLRAVDDRSGRSTISLTAMATMQCGADLLIDLDLSGTATRTQLTLEFERSACELDFFPEGFRVLPRRRNPIDDTAAALERLAGFGWQRLRPRQDGVPRRVLPHRAIYAEHLRRVNGTANADAFSLEHVRTTMTALFQICDRAYPHSADAVATAGMQAVTDP